MLIKYLDVYNRLVEGDLLIKEQQTVQDLKNAGDEEIVVKEKSCKNKYNYRILDCLIQVKKYCSHL